MMIWREDDDMKRGRYGEGGDMERGGRFGERGDMERGGIYGVRREIWRYDGDMGR